MAYFGDATLVFADFRGANLTDAAFTGATGMATARLDGAIWSYTVCPDGTNSDDDDGDGFTCLSNLVP